MLYSTICTISVVPKYDVAASPTSDTIMHVAGSSQTVGHSLSSLSFLHPALCDNDPNLSLLRSICHQYSFNIYHDY